MSAPLPHYENERSSEDRAAQPRKRPHRMARWLTAIVAILVLLVILGALALHGLFLVNHGVTGLSAEVQRTSAQATQFHQSMLQALAGIQRTLNTISVQLYRLIETVGHFTNHP